MKERFHITRKVLIGYGLLIAAAILSVIYIFNIVEEFATENTTDDISRRKVYLVTNTQSLLYESEALSQFVDFGKKADTTEVNPGAILDETFDLAQRNLDSLRMLSNDSSQHVIIDTISSLIERKRYNTKELLSIWNDADFEKLYNQNINKVLASQDKLAKEVAMLKKVQVHEDTVFVKKKPKSFLKRVADVFSPSKGDSGVVRRSSREYIADKTGGVYNPSDTISSVLKRLQRNVAGQRKELYALIVEYAGKLRYDNRQISREVDSMLRDIESQELNASLESMNSKQQIIGSASRFIAAVAILSVIIVLLFVYLIAKDVSRSKFYRRQLEKAKKYAEDLLVMREKLMLTISHDIRAPLSSIIGYTELLQRLHPDGRQRYYLDNMNASSGHILALVNDLLDFHRLESNKMEFNIVPFNVSSLLNEIYLSFKPMADTKGLKFVIHEKNEDKDLFMEGDPIRIRQIISNLLSNAIKFTAKGSVVLGYEVTHESGKYTLHIIVSDQGCGIPEADKNKLFNEFTRVAGSEGADGFGLGLAITHKLVVLMNGTLSFESEVGKGSMFCVDIPLTATSVQEVKAVDADQSAFQPSDSKPSLHCLLVDDDPIQLALAKELLGYLGILVERCSDASKVKELLQKDSYDFVITDIQMPQMSGFELLKVIRSLDDKEIASMPVVALSGSVPNDSDLANAGFTAFLTKPYTLKQLQDLVRTIFPDHISAASELNLDALTAFAGDDAQASNAILKTFCDETSHNLSLFKKALEKKDRKEAARLAHKFLPLFSMIGAKDLTPALETLEKKSDPLSDAEWSSLMTSSIDKIGKIVSSIRHKIVD
ncbi:ATP-binding protein [Macellibacteroides fermentans]